MTYINEILGYFEENKNLVIPLGMFILFILIAFLAHHFSNKNRIIRAFKAARRKQINRIQAHEYAKVIGRAKPKESPLIGPLSGRSCVYYHVLVEVKGDKNWRRLVNEEQFQDFFIESNSEKALVKITSLKKQFKVLYLVKDYKEHSGFRNTPSKKLEAYLKAHGKNNLGVFGINKTIRYQEGIIEVEETIGVKGVAHWQTLDEPINNYTYSKILTLSGNKKQKLLVTDEPKALLRDKTRL